MKIVNRIKGVGIVDFEDGELPSDFWSWTEAQRNAYMESGIRKIIEQEQGHKQKKPHKKH